MEVAIEWNKQDKM